MHRSSKFALALFVLAIFAAAAWWYLRRSGGGEVHLSPWSEQSVPRFVLTTQPIYLQYDPAWSTERIGGSGEEFSAVGCTVCCLCMAMAQHGVALTPLELNSRLKQAGGYTDRGWIRWNVLQTVTDGKIDVQIPRHATHGDIDTALTAGNPVLVKVLFSPGVPHWVLIVGRDQKEYLIKDPLGDGKNLDLLSAYHSDILAVRIVRKT
jgi:hypothetical protein